MAERPSSPSGPLRPVELATAAVLGGIAVALSVLGWLLPHASVVQALGAVPIGLLAYRHRPRAVVAAAVAGCVVSFLVAGTGPAYSVVTCAIVGGVVGDTKRRRRGAWTLAAVTAVLAPVLAAAADALLVVFSASRALALDQIRHMGRGVTGVTARIPALRGASLGANRLIDIALRDWWATIALLVIVGLVVGVTIAWVVLGSVLARLAWMVPVDLLEAPDDRRPVAPLPVSMRDVAFRYPQAGCNALEGIDLRLEGVEMVAVVGSNGSGKSTLTRILAGRAPTAGEVVRAGAAGLGHTGGTALVSQRPESQVLGVRVADDVVWGLPPGMTVDVEALLRSVGLAGMEARDTATLSGGQMQRLAIAAALARRPRLLLSDESTAMLDAEGRRDVTSLLAGLPATRPMTVVHVTHRAEEAGAADRVVRLSRGRMLDGADDEPAIATADVPARADPPAAAPQPPSTGGEVAGSKVLLRVEGVFHTYAQGTPWAQPALRGVDLAVGEGDGLLVVGGNGSGKSTLAWILAGLLQPSQGSCLLGGRPVSSQVGAVALAFQHARLQLQRPTVGADVMAAAGVGPDAMADALADMGFDPAFAARSIDQLSGGEMRRVALAGLLAHRPQVVILDEPLAGLDLPSREGLLGLLARLRRQGVTLIVISHDLEGMGSVCERIVRLDRGQIATGNVAATPATGAGVGH